MKRVLKSVFRPLKANGCTHLAAFYFKLKFYSRKCCDKLTKCLIFCKKGYQNFWDIAVEHCPKLVVLLRPPLSLCGRDDG